jgi:hypothetical protein
MLHQVLHAIFSYPITFITATVTASVVIGMVSLDMVDDRRDQNLKQRSDMYNENDDEDSIAMTTYSNTAKQQPQQQKQRRQKKTILTPEAARVRAMIDNAKESTWRENLSNAAEAHRHFVLPPGHVNNDSRKPSRETSNLLRNIEKRSEKLLQEQQRELERQSKRKLTTRFWKN